MSKLGYAVMNIQSPSIGQIYRKSISPSLKSNGFLRRLKQRDNKETREIQILVLIKRALKLWNNISYPERNNLICDSCNKTTKEGHTKAYIISKKPVSYTTELITIPIKYNVFNYGLVCNKCIELEIVTDKRPQELILRQTHFMARLGAKLYELQNNNIKELSEEQMIWLALKYSIENIRLY